MNVEYFKNPVCNKCDTEMEPVYYEKKLSALDKSKGKSSLGVDYFVCPICGKKEIVDDSFDKYLETKLTYLRGWNPYND